MARRVPWLRAFPAMKTLLTRKARGLNDHLPVEQCPRRVEKLHEARLLNPYLFRDSLAEARLMQPTPREKRPVGLLNVCGSTRRCGSLDHSSSVRSVDPLPLWQSAPIIRDARSTPCHFLGFLRLGGSQGAEGTLRVCARGIGINGVDRTIVLGLVSLFTSALLKTLQA